MTNDMLVLDAMRLSIRNEVYIDISGAEAMIVTGCQVGTPSGPMACLTVEFVDGTTGTHDVPSASTVHVTRVVS